MHLFLWLTTYDDDDFIESLADWLWNSVQGLLSLRDESENHPFIIIIINLCRLQTTLNTFVYMNVFLQFFNEFMNVFSTVADNFVSKYLTVSLAILLLISSLVKPYLTEWGLCWQIYYNSLEVMKIRSWGTELVTKNFHLTNSHPPNRWITTS